MPDGRCSPTETSPLLRSSASSLRSYDDSEDECTLPPTPPEFAPLNKVSKTDLAWVLAGLWSAVFLGALDGVYETSERDDIDP